MKKFRLLAILLFGIPQVAEAQNRLVQLPVVQQFSIDTSVSVPDRGSTFLGGVGTSASSTANYGPPRMGSRFGREQSTSSATAHVFVHDFETMDRLLRLEGQRRLFSTDRILSQDRRVQLLRSGSSVTKFTSVNALQTDAQSSQSRQDALAIIRATRGR